MGNNVEAPELLPCPFCGRGAEYKEDTGEYRNFASCTSRECGASICGVWLEDPSTIQRWNHRESADMAECAAFSAGYEAGEAGRADLAAPSTPVEVEGLVERLSNAGHGGSIVPNPRMCREAAAALTALQAENERLRVRVQELGTEGHAYREGKVAGVAQMQARAEKAEAELAKIVDGIADDATAIPEACGKLHDLLCLPDDANPSAAYDWAREAYDLLIPVSGRAIDRAAHAKLKGEV